MMFQVQLPVEPDDYYGLNWKQINDGWVCKAIEDDKIVTAIASENNNSQIWLYAKEKGGRNKNTGISTIICRADGSPMKPLYYGGHKNGDHAIFVIKDCVEITTTFDIKLEAKYYITINHISVFIDKRFKKPNINNDLLWIGECSKCSIKDKIPSGIRKFLPAIMAGIGKASDCYHCREPHFIV